MPWGELPRPSVDSAKPNRSAQATPAGLVVVDKDRGVTSHDIVGAMRRLAGTRKVGHAGTLDPMATGVLCVAIGPATKLLQYVAGTSKEYVATIRFGISTATEDAEGQILQAPGCALADSQLGQGTVPCTKMGQGTVPCPKLEEGRIGTAMAELTGQIMQVPSAVSAIKVNGKRAYDLVREGKEVELEARPVTIHAFTALGAPRPVLLELPGVDEPALACRELSETERLDADETAKTVVAVDLDVRVECSVGTYIRALARDLGAKLGTQAHLTALRRTRVGVWGEQRALTVAELAEYVGRGEAMPIVALADLCQGLFPVLEISEEEAAALRHGQFLPSSRLRGAQIVVAMREGHPVALVEPHPARRSQAKPSLVFPET